MNFLTSTSYYVATRHVSAYVQLFIEFMQGTSSAWG